MSKPSIKHAVILAIRNPNHHSQLTYDRAPAMLPALGKPLVIRIMDRLYRAGIRHYTVIVGADEGQVTAYLNRSWMPDTTIDLLIKFDSDTLLKMMQQIAHKHQEPFIFCSYNCFTHKYFTDSLIKQYTENPDDLILSATSRPLSQTKHRYYAVMNGHHIQRITATPSPQDYTLSLYDFGVCGQKVIEHLTTADDQTITANRPKQIMDIAQQYIDQGGKVITADTAWILQVMMDGDLLTLNKHLLDEGQDTHILSEIPYTVEIISPVRIDPQVSIGQGTKIGPHVYLERGCTVGRNVTLRDAIILSGANVPSQKNASTTVISKRGPIA